MKLKLKESMESMSAVCEGPAEVSLGAPAHA